MIDLSKLQKGDTVKFLCGGEVEVEDVKIKRSGDIKYKYQLFFEDFSSLDFLYNNEGECGSGIIGDCPFDIIEIIPAAFDWSTVKQGDAFDWLGHTIIYVRPSITDEECNLFECKRSYKNGCAVLIHKDHIGSDDLTRAPEHDIEVKS